ncbi:hypothetical protein Poly30_18790 [Planctomycetes bacterium Poly30]|uniref:Amidohydrolase 3 domain-containing protein n=1 Tax=Saltatorellus ferox TaxID=2528018 RepID=A0A518EQL1_9BACT|nr:hypothetical protein Poly30_18790 [Planctomycetes bacterium Poly30]
MILPLLLSLAATAAPPLAQGPGAPGGPAGPAEPGATATTRAFVGARILPISGPEIETGVLVVSDGKIVSVTAGGAVPEGAEVIDAAGKTIMPGLVCTHSHLGGIGGADGSGPIQPDVRVSDSINVRDAGYMRALAGGLTALNVMPGSGHLLSGQTCYLKLRADASTIEDMFIRDADGAPTGGIKMANGTNPMRGGAFPGTRGRSAALVRQQFIAAQEYMAKIEAAGDDETKLPNRHIGMEALAEVLSGKRVVHHHTHRHDDILTVLRLAEEFHFRVVLHHVSEAWKVADEIAASGAACSIILVDSPGGKPEAIDVAFKTGGVLERAGVKVAFHTDDWITDSRLFLRMGALAVRAGMSREGALRALTLSGAEILELEDRIGSLEPGKDADFTILDGDPFSVYTKVLETWVEGEKRFDRGLPEHALYAEGGYGAAHDQEPYFCCFGLQAGGQ